MKVIAVIPNALRDIGLEETKKLTKFLTGRNKTVLMETRFQEESLSGVSFCSLEEMMQEADLAVVLGGDGTILDIAPQVAQYDIPVLGINLGNLGFLTQAEKGNYEIFDAIFNGEYELRRCMMLDCTILKNEEEIGRHLALNDVVVSGDGYSRMITLSAFINGTCIGNYSADGLIVATAVGSTAYSLSAGGAIMHPDMDAMILTPICPHTIKARSTVIPGEDTIEIISQPPYRSSVLVLIDGKRRHVLEPDEQIRITRSECKIRLIQAKNRNFFDVLRQKLSD